MKASNTLRGGPSSNGFGEVLARFWRLQSPLARGSYAAGALGLLLAVHDFHHPKDSFGLSTPVLGLAIVLYLLGLRRTR